MPPYTESPESAKNRKEQVKLLRPRIINGRKTFVKFLPQDDLEAIHPVYLSDPTNFKPRRHLRGDTLDWGIVELDNSVELSMAEAIQRRLLRDNAMIKCMYHRELQPQAQFIQALMEKKRERIAAARAQDPERQTRDFILTIRLRASDRASTADCLMWRRIKVAGATKISVFQDKILAPALGWTRNYHGYLFIDDSDGAQYGAPGASHIDLMWLKDNGHTYLDDDGFTLADILPNPNTDKPGFHYIYDLGDHWFHDIYIESILPASESDGKVALLAGGGACPREDGQGAYNWKKYLQSLDSPTDTFSSRHAEIAQSMNYLNDPDILRLGLRWRFDPTFFSLPAAQKRIADALASPASVPSGPKKGAIGNPFAAGRGFGGDSVPKGTHRTVSFPDASSFNPFSRDSPLKGFFQQTEVVRDRRDKRADALCASCGKPISDPRMCAACLKVYYCGRECQAAHWKKEHKRLCAGRQAKVKQCNPAHFLESS
ncbi:MYND-type domain-containing protein [Favolaschia claudopus]|uniref:MYND-type domain-containing protein n=1 Tax=Favolaschia claudopus TaxID=2862362 RepID=A0AAW0DSH3_9AGAR